MADTAESSRYRAAPFTFSAGPPLAPFTYVLAKIAFEMETPRYEQVTSFFQFKLAIGLSNSLPITRSSRIYPLQEAVLLLHACFVAFSIFSIESPETFGIIFHTMKTAEAKSSFGIIFTQHDKSPSEKIHPSGGECLLTDYFLCFIELTDISRPRVPEGKLIQCYGTAVLIVRPNCTTK